MRQTRIEIEVAGADVTTSLIPFLTKFSFSDSIDKKSDSFSFTLYDEDWRHLRQWILPKGTEIRARIIQEDETGANQLDCGKTQVDDLHWDVGTGGSTLEIKTNSVPVKGKAKGSKKYRAWEGADVKQISEQVAADSGLEVQWEVQTPPQKQSRTDQDGESDLELLQRLCDENGHCMKVTDGKVVIFNEEDYEKREPWTELAPGAGNYDGLKLHTTATGKFASAEASWTSPRTGKTVKEKFTPDEPPEGAGAELWDYRRYNRDGDDDEDETDGDEARIAARAGEYEWETASGNVAEKSGARKAKAKSTAATKLRESNKGEWKITFSTVGDIRWGAGETFTLSQEFGKFGRKYIVQSVTHEVSRDSGYSCSVSAHGVLRGY
jgi:phage protein D